MLFIFKKIKVFCSVSGPGFFYFIFSTVLLFRLLQNLIKTIIQITSISKWTDPDSDFKNPDPDRRKKPDPSGSETLVFCLENLARWGGNKIQNFSLCSLLLQLMMIIFAGVGSDNNGHVSSSRDRESHPMRELGSSGGRRQQQQMPYPIFRYQNTVRYLQYQLSSQIRIRIIQKLMIPDNSTQTTAQGQICVSKVPEQGSAYWVQVGTKCRP